MSQKPYKDRIVFSLFALRAEAEGAKGISAFLIVAALVFIAKWMGLL
jgi:hypothetical protein